MATAHKRATVYFDEELHRALRLKAAETDRSMSDLVNEEVKTALAEDAEDLIAFEERALEWLESGYEVRDPDMHYLGALWLSEEIRDEPGYHDLLRRMNLQDVLRR